jgi:hypothetical protein
MAKEEPGAVREVGGRYQLQVSFTIDAPPELMTYSGARISLVCHVETDTRAMADLWANKLALCQLALDTPDAEAVLKAMHRMKGEGE